jgi:hypothetical protein
MGWPKKKRKTKTEVTKEKFTLSKIVKFTYLQTLAIDGGLTTAKGIGGETEAKEETTTGNDVRRNFFQKAEDEANKLIGSIDPIGVLPKISNPFGKKVSVDTKQTTKESGWTVTKIWNQPQFDIIRYAIGIRELTIAQFTYEQVSELISVPWASPKEIIKVSLNVSEFIPKVFPPGTYIEYYIKPNIKDFSWVRINPIGSPSVFNEDGSLVPRIINFNVERPISSRLEDNYITTEEPVKEIVFRALLKRPDLLEGTEISADGYSPILKSYRLLMVPRNGL